MKMEVLGDFSTFRAPYTKTYKIVIMFGAFGGPLGAEMVISPKFHPFSGKSTFYPRIDIFHILAIFIKNDPCPPIPAWPGPGPAQDPGPGLARLRIPAPARDPGAGLGSRRWLGITAPARDPGAGSGSWRRLGIPAPARDPGATGSAALRCVAGRGAAASGRREMLIARGRCRSPTGNVIYSRAMSVAHK